ncbi:hypothetical protein [Klebsiella pneumoniae]|uniref:hypothetical protein n=1 Tax=Klebsiella pneumoniae TaxID=573 RepID=UPI0032178127
MNDFITEAWLRANHTLSEGGEIHLPADARLTPSARELLESRHLRVKFLDRHGRDVALLNLLRGKVREAEVTAAQVFITPQFAVRRADIMQALNRLSSAVYVMMILGVTDAPPALSQLQQLGGEDDH